MFGLQSREQIGVDLHLALQTAHVNGGLRIPQVPLAVMVALLSERLFPVGEGQHLRLQLPDHLRLDVVDLLLLFHDLRMILGVIDQKVVALLDQVQQALIQDRQQRILFLSENPPGLIADDGVGASQHGDLPFALRPLPHDIVVLLFQLGERLECRPRLIGEKHLPLPLLERAQRFF